MSCPYSDVHCQAAITDFNIQYGQPFGGIVTVEEGYLETNLPLAKDLPFAKLLEVDIAGASRTTTTRRCMGSTWSTVSSRSSRTT